MARKTVGNEERDGSLSVEADTSTPALQVTQTGSGNALVVEDSSNPDSTPFLIDSNGNVGVGANTPTQDLHVFTALTGGSPATSGAGNDPNASTRIQMSSVALDVGTTAAGGAWLQSRRFDDYASNFPLLLNPNGGNVGIGKSSPSRKLDLEGNTSIGMRIVRNTSDGASPNFEFQKRRGTSASPVIVNNNDFLGNIAFSGYDGTTEVVAAQILAAVDGTPSTGNMPGRIRFNTRASAGVMTERLRIDNAGLITGSGTSLGAWTAYTPTLSGFTLGNGTVTGFYCQIGKLVFVRIRFVLGSTSAAASANITLSLPVNAKTAGANTQGGVFTGGLHDASTATPYIAGAYLSTTSQAVLRRISTDGSLQYMDTTAPFTWGVGDSAFFTGTYEAA